MNVIVLNGSGRGDTGLTNRLIKSFSQGLRCGGAEISTYNLKEMNISPCRGCLACMHKTSGVCVIKDDMHILYDEFKKSDLFVMGTPVYTDSMTAQMKSVIDRCMCSMSPFLRKAHDGRVRHEYNWRMPEKFFLLSTCAFPENETFLSLISTYKAQLDNFDSSSAGEICIPGALALMTEPGLLTERLGMIERAGELIASGMGLPDETMILLNRPLISRDEYLKIAERYINWCRIQVRTVSV